MAEDPVKRQEEQGERRHSESERRALYRAKRGKNLAVLAALVGFAVLVYLVSIVRMSG